MIWISFPMFGVCKPSFGRSSVTIKGPTIEDPLCPDVYSLPHVGKVCWVADKYPKPQNPKVTNPTLTLNLSPTTLNLVKRCWLPNDTSAMGSTGFISVSF